MTETINDPHAEIKALMDKWASMQRQHGETIKQIEDLKTKIKEAARRTTESLIESDFAQALIEAGSVRATWNGKSSTGM